MHLKSNFTAKIIKDSINADNERITTFELEYNRYIHSELMTHRLFSRNSASSRAIPVAKIIEQVRNNPATPIHWGKNEAGMQSSEELQGVALEAASIRWKEAANKAANIAEEMSAGGGHKQWVNRILEPFQVMKVVVTSTDFDNWFWLRDHKDAQPEIRYLAQLMKQELDKSEPEFLVEEQWHLPYVRTNLLLKTKGGWHTQQCYYNEYGSEITPDEAIKISCSSCAQVSYRKLDTSLEKAEIIYDKLVNSEPVHASAFEHVAKCEIKDSTVRGWTHQDFKGNFYSGNFRGFVQYRQLIDNHSKSYSK